MTDAHNPRLLSDADAAADLAGVARPSEGLRLLYDYGQAITASGDSEEIYMNYAAAREYIKAIEAERDALAVRVRELEAERDEITELNHAQWLALENVRHLAARNRNEEWAQHMLRWCTEAGSAARILRAALTTPESKP